MTENVLLDVIRRLLSDFRKTVAHYTAVTRYSVRHVSFTHAQKCFVTVLISDKDFCSPM